ncbi:MAG: hypothetical protein KQH79_00555 [Bacteroidetes bacterium]|nr:hypothetical protein [Bacteroidota bacterium]
MGYRLFLVVGLLLFSNAISANNEDKILDSDITLDFRTMHIWRGSATSYTPTFEPSFEITRNNYTTGIWFAQSIDGNYTELDLYFSYNVKNFSFTIYDYYCPPSIETSKEITNYDKYTTKHTIELNAAFNGTKQLPIKLLVATMVYGDDINSDNNKNYYSTYVELGYSTVIDENALDIFVGFNTFESYYGDDFGIVNAGLTTSRNLKIYKSFEVPVQASIITNPMANSLFLNFGFTL